MSWKFFHFLLMLLFTKQMSFFVFNLYIFDMYLRTKLLVDVTLVGFIVIQFSLSILSNGCVLIKYSNLNQRLFHLFQSIHSFLIHNFCKTCPRRWAQRTQPVNEQIIFAIRFSKCILCLPLSILYTYAYYKLFECRII